MDEIRCPMCGKSNPADLEICQFCQARLTPLTGASLPQDDQTDYQDEAPLSSESGDQASMDDWLSFLRESDDTAGLGAEPDDTSADWQEEEPESTSEQDFWVESEPLEADIPDWLKSMGSEEPESPDLAHPAEAAQEQPFQSQEDEEPDWLQRIRDRKIAEDEDQPPDDFVYLDEPERETDFGYETAPSAGFSTEQAAEEPDAQEFSEQEGGPAAAVEQPADSEPAQDEPASDAPAAREAEIPDWMAGLVAGSVAAEEPVDVDADLEGLPEWLSDLEKSSALDQEEIVPFGEEGHELTFDWLQAQVRADQDFPAGDMTDADTDAAEAGVTGPFIGDLSDFLEDAELSSQESLEAADLQAGDDLAPADLPNWLEAMRPIEAAAAGAYALGDEDAPLESSGPLAGLQGVLPAEPEIAQLKKPVAYALRLQVSDTQRAHADLFDELVKSEGAPQALPARPSVSSQYLFRLIIFLVLLLAIAWPVFTGSQVIPLPGLLPEVFDTSQIITNLPNNPLVLLAVDYEPGLAGELEATSSVVIDHLMLKGAYFALVSTTPNGPALAERLIADVSSRGGHSYQGIDQFANLGYLPGGVIGLQGFARAPRQVVPYALDPDSTSVWTQAPLDQVQLPSDFDLVALLTDDPERARAWIEQVQPTLSGKPMVAFLSSQAEPLVRPYYQAVPKQVQGMVVGVAGGGSYENAHQELAARSGLASKYWDALTLSIIAAAFLIVVGGAVNIIARMMEVQKQSKLDGRS